MIVLDTTVLVYAKGADHPLREPCRSLIEALATGALEATTTVEVIQEFAHVRARRFARAEAAARAGDYAEILSPLLPVGREQLEGGLEIFASTPGVGAFDAVLAAAALDADASAVVSADRAFGAVPDVHHVFPDDAGVDLLLSRPA